MTPHRTHHRDADAVPAGADRHARRDPYVVGFHPSDSVVVLGMRGRRLHLHACDSTCQPARNSRSTSSATISPGAAARQSTHRRVMSSATGPTSGSGPCSQACRGPRARDGVSGARALRADGGRYWSYLCRTRAAARRRARRTTRRAAGRGRVDVAGWSPCRTAADYEASSSRCGAARSRCALREATTRAHDRLVALLAASRRGRRRSAGCVTAGAAAVGTALGVVPGAGDGLTDDEVGWLSVLLMRAGARSSRGRGSARPAQIDAPPCTVDGRAAPCRAGSRARAGHPVRLRGLAVRRRRLAAAGARPRARPEPRLATRRRLLRRSLSGLPPSALAARIDLDARWVQQTGRGPRRRRRSSSRRVESRPA